MNSNNRMEVNLNQDHLKALQDADLASDGVLNGDSLDNAMVDVLDRMYLGAPSASVDRTINDALEEASLRRQGLLPNSQRPVANPSLEAIAASQARRVGGACPFASQPPVQAPSPNQGTGGTSSGGYGSQAPTVPPPSTGGYSPIPNPFRSPSGQPTPQPPPTGGYTPTPTPPPPAPPPTGGYTPTPTPPPPAPPPPTGGYTPTPPPPAPPPPTGGYTPTPPPPQPPPPTPPPPTPTPKPPVRY